MQLFTIGHSNHTFEQFVKMLQAYEIEFLVDIRTIPKSRFVQWSNQNQLNAHLAKYHINYLHAKGLGGRRKPAPNSINTAWKNLSFRGFADYMQTQQFFVALKQLNQLVKSERNIVIMCAESVPWRCHRSLISDAELARGVEVNHILSATNIHPHEMTDFAVIDKSHKPIRVYYPEKKQLEML